MSKFRNSKKKEFLEKIPDTDIENSEIEKKCKFNFSYFDPSQLAGQPFSDWSTTTHGDHTLLLELMEKIKHYTKEPLTYWASQRAGAGSLKIFECYKTFPKNSDFTHPKHVPHDVHWARFRLGNIIRLVGFILPPDEKENKGFIQLRNGHAYDTNTFYVVFLDKNHKFYKTEQG